MFNSRNPPRPVARFLRQEAGFGCAECGSPIIEYHHIIEWKERQHFEPEHMLALCPTHHTEFGKLPRERSYRAKRNPINIRTGRLKGYLGGNKKQKSLQFGPFSFKNAMAKIEFGGLEILSYRLEEEEYLLSCFIPNNDFWPLVKVVNSEMAVSIADFWDIEFKTNWVRFKETKEAKFLEIDFRGEEIEVSCDIDLAGKRAAFSEP